MSHSSKKSLWLLLLIPVIFLLWYSARGRVSQSGDGTVTPADERRQGQAQPRTDTLPAITGATGISMPRELYLGGEPGAPVKIEVFSDYQCPKCRDFYLLTLKPLLADYAKANKTDKIYIVYRDYPLEMHQFARKAARLALAAERLGRDRWLRVVDALYREQDQWSQDGNIGAILAKVLDPTDLVRVAKLAADPATDAAVGQEIMLAQSRNIISTPTFFITASTGLRQRVEGMITFTTLKDFIDRLLTQ
ncbi:MAG: DsbA family protein [Acidobacteriia bacterium]|nr:DsbA family protein [Terriglobia bacterium]